MSMFTMTMMVVGLSWSAAPAVWHVDYAQAHAESLSSDKPLFIVFCPGSQGPDRATASLSVSESVGRVLHADYVRLVVDTDSAAGKQLASQFEAVDPLHVVILDRSGKWQVYYESGPIGDAKLIAALAQFRRAKLTPEGKPVAEATKRPVIQLCST
jgi:hypothetical protein